MFSIKKYAILCVLLNFGGMAMEPAFSQVQQDSQDEVLAINLSGLLATQEPIFCDQFGYCPGAYAHEREQLRSIASTRACADAIKQLFAQWTGLKNHWIAHSMLLSAVQMGTIANINALLDLGIDPHVKAYYFFHSNRVDVGRSPLEHAFGVYETKFEPSVNKEVIQAVLAKIQNIDQTLGLRCMFKSLENSLHRGDKFIVQIKMLLDKDVDPFGELDEKNHVACNGKYYGAKSPAKLAEILLPLNASCSKYVKDEQARQEMNAAHQATFAEIIKLFDTYKQEKSKNAQITP